MGSGRPIRPETPGRFHPIYDPAPPPKWTTEQCGIGGCQEWVLKGGGIWKDVDDSGNMRLHKHQPETPPSP